MFNRRKIAELEWQINGLEAREERYLTAFRKAHADFQMLLEHLGVEFKDMTARRLLVNVTAKGDKQ